MNFYFFGFSYYNVSKISSFQWYKLYLDTKSNKVFCGISTIRGIAKLYLKTRRHLDVDVSKFHKVDVADKLSLL